MKTERENQSIKLFHKTDMRRKIVRISAILAFIVACVTTVRLIMPAVAMTKTVRHLDCAYEVHTHDDSCYGIVTDEEGNTSEQLICGKADYVLHTHNDDCYEEVTHTEIVDGEEAEVTEWVLTCPLEERAAHFHDDSCYETTVDEEGNEVETLICGELEPHTHTSDCYERGHEGDPGYLICGQLELTEHVHDADCIYEEDVEVEDAEPAEEEIVGAEDEEELEGSEYSEDFEEGTEIEEGSEAGEEIGDADVDPEFAEENGLAAEGAEAGEEISEDTVDDEAAEETGEAAEETEAGEAVEDTVEAGAGMEEAEGDGEKASSEENRKQDVMNETSADENGEAEGKDYPEQTFEDATEKVRVSVKAPAGALPAGTTMHVADVDDEKTIETIRAAVDESAHISEVNAVDITFKNAAGEEIEPLRSLEVTMESIAPVEADASVVVHVDDAGKAETVEQEASAAEAGDGNEEADEGIEEVKDTEAGEESEEDVVPEEGESEEESESAEADNGALEIRGADGEEDVRGDKAADETAADAVEKDTVTETNTNTDADKIADTEENAESGAEEVADGTETASVTFSASEFSVYALVYTVDFHWEVDGKEYEFSLAGGDAVSFRELVNALDIVGDSSEEDKEDISEEDIEDEQGESDKNVISNELDLFINDVADIEFSDESLVKVAKIEEGITAGALKEKLNLESEYSSELSDARKKTMDEKIFRPVDWALISLKPFNSEEYLTVTLKTGDVFKILVTDAQIQKDFISASGENYTITVIYGEDAGIPDGSELMVEEIESGTQEYKEYLTDSAEKLGVESNDVSFARFFDIEIVNQGEKLEPKATVQVKIEYKDSIDGSASLNVIHFAEEGTEIISDVNIADDGKEIIYEQNSFSVTGTVVTPVNNNSDHEYMLLVKGPVIEGKNVYYIINNDGTLSPVPTEWNPDGTLKAVHVTEPMAWNYRNNHIYHEYDAMAYNQNHAAAEFVYRYLNPGEESGLTTEESSDVTLGNLNMWTQMYDNSVRSLWNSTGITYNSQDHRLSNNGMYLGVTADGDGTLRIAGKKSYADSAELYFAKPEVVEPRAANNAVNHIDISVRGSSEIEVPLAFGEYFDANGTKLFDVSATEQRTIAAESPVRIELEDMKRAVITAYQKDTDGTILPLDDAFYITGFSQNDPSGIGSTGDARQIRIEGSFQTSKSIHGEDINQFDNATQTYKNRLNDRVYYTVSVTKPITFVLKDGDTELYDATGKPVTITLDITMSASFDYWDPRNECPPLRMEMYSWGQTYVDENGNNFKDWQRGGYTTWTGDMTGMDFQLGGDADDASSNIVAVEITKMIMDPDGNLIQPANEISQSFEIWGSSTDDHKNVIGTDVPEYAGENDTYNRSSYSYLHSKNMKVGSSGIGLVHHFSINWTFPIMSRF